jgi:hypothetical protein
MIKKVKDIKLNTTEGKLLLTAIAKITTESQTDKTPDEVVDQLNILSEKMYGETEKDKAITYFISYDTGSGIGRVDVSLTREIETIEDIINIENRLVKEGIADQCLITNFIKM